MLSFTELGTEIAARRKTLRLSQLELARKAGVSRATLAALENGRTGELGYSKITKILSALGLDLQLQEVKARRPTLEQLLNEGSNDKGLDRRY